MSFRRGYSYGIKERTLEDRPKIDTRLEWKDMVLYIWATSNLAGSEDRYSLRFLRFFFPFSFYGYLF